MAPGVPYTEKALTDFDIKRASTDINLSRLVSGLADIVQSLIFLVNRLPMEVVPCPSLEVLKTRMDKALRNLV